MPIYEFFCESCETEFEHLQRSMSSQGRPLCPKCSSKKTTRKLSIFAVAADASKTSSIGEMPPTCGRCGGAPGSCQM